MIHKKLFDIFLLFDLYCCDILIYNLSLMWDEHMTFEEAVSVPAQWANWALESVLNRVDIVVILDFRHSFIIDMCVWLCFSEAGTWWFCEHTSCLHQSWKCKDGMEASRYWTYCESFLKKTHFRVKRSVVAWSEPKPCTCHVKKTHSVVSYVKWHLTAKIHVEAA